FSPLDTKWKLFERKDGIATSVKIIDFPFNVSRQALNRVETYEPAPTKKNLVDTFTKILLENYSPAALLINEKGDIIYINGKTGRYLELNSGEAVMNIHRMVKEELKYVLVNAIHQARLSKNEVSVEDIKVKEEKDYRLVSLKVSLLENTQ